MTTFNDREKGFENKFAHDEEMQFKAVARRNRLLGLWAASLLGKTGDEAAAYAMEVVKADFAEPANEDVFHKLAGRPRRTAPTRRRSAPRWPSSSRWRRARSSPRPELRGAGRDVGHRSGAGSGRSVGDEVAARATDQRARFSAKGMPA